MNWTKIKTLKTNANTAFSKKDYNKSFKYRTESIELINLGHNSVAAVIHSNLAQIYLNKEDYLTAIQHANKSLEYDSSFNKSMLRRATANCELKNYDIALIALRYLYEREPNNSQVTSLMHRSSDKPKMEDKLQKTYFVYYLRHALKKPSVLRDHLLRQLFLSAENFDFVAQLFPGTCVQMLSPSHVNFDLIRWFYIYVKLPYIPPNIELSMSMFKIIFQLARPGTFSLALKNSIDVDIVNSLDKFDHVYYYKCTFPSIQAIDTNDLKCIEHNAHLMNRLAYLPGISKFKNNQFPKLRTLCFKSKQSVDMKFLKMWRKNQWPVRTIIFDDNIGALKDFKKFGETISNHVSDAFLFSKNLGSKGVFDDLCPKLDKLKKFFLGLSNVFIRQDLIMKSTTFPSFVEDVLKVLIGKLHYFVNKKPEWCPKLKILTCVICGYSSLDEFKHINVDLLKSYINTYRREFSLFVSNLRLRNASAIEFYWDPEYFANFMLEFETDVADFQIAFIPSRGLQI